MSRFTARLADKPQYVFHPARAARRAWRSVNPRAASDRREQVTELPWGLPLRVTRSDAIGYSIATGKVFDPCVSEAFQRLINPGDRVVDVGANVGYLTSLAAVRSGQGGQVIAVEPQPQVYAALQENVASWHGRVPIAVVQLRQSALSDHVGEGELVTAATFGANMGLSALKAAGEQTAADDTIHRVVLERLDDIVGDCEVGLLKIDVEGHELEVLRGAPRLLAERRVRDLIFEDHGDYPNATTQLVEAAGYTLLGLEGNLLGVRLVAPAGRKASSAWPGPSYLATRDPARARQRLRGRGWQVPGILPRRVSAWLG